MKKFTLIAAAAMIGFAAQAQYTCDASNAEVAKKGPKAVDYIILSEEAIASFTKAGATMNYVGPSPDEGRNLWYWNGFNPASDSYPRVDFDEGGYTAVEVANGVNWSGAGFNIYGPQDATPGAGVNISHFNDNTIFHMAYFSPTDNGPVSIGVTLLDDSAHGSAPAHFAIGANYDDNGTIWPSIAPKAGDDWAGLEISLGDLKKLWPAFDLKNTQAWGGNIFAWLAGNVAGQTMAFDAMYFYSTEEAGLNEVGVDSNNVDFVVTENTVNVMGANGIVLYNMAGGVVKSAQGTTLGINGLPAGVYVAKAAGKACKVIVK